VPFFWDGSGSHQCIATSAIKCNVILGITPGEKRRSRMKNRKLYVGNLGDAVTNDELQELLTNDGDVEKVNIIEGKG
jgi:hypothetical protein